MFIVIARTTYGSIEDRDEVAKVSAMSTLETLKEPGVIFYQNAPDRIDPLVTNVVEIYKSEEALLAHMTSPHMAVLYKAAAGKALDTQAKAFRGDMEPVDLTALMEKFGISTGSES